MTRTQGRVALVTGADRGSGLEVCRQLARLDFTALLGSRDPGQEEATGRERAAVRRALVECGGWPWAGATGAPGEVA